jgi:hypothetical protein
VAELTAYIVDDKQVTDSFAIELLTLNSALFYLFLDHQAFAYLKTADREQFSDGLLYAIVARLAEILELPVEDWDDIGQAINEQMNLLGPYARKLFADKDGNPKGTLFWEYAKILQERLEIDPGRAMTASLISPDLAINLWNEIKHIFPKKPFA